MLAAQQFPGAAFAAHAPLAAGAEHAIDVAFKQRRSGAEPDRIDQHEDVDLAEHRPFLGDIGAGRALPFRFAQHRIELHPVEIPNDRFVPVRPNRLGVAFGRGHGEALAVRMAHDDRVLESLGHDDVLGLSGTEQ